MKHHREIEDHQRIQFGLTICRLEDSFGAAHMACWKLSVGPESEVDPGAFRFFASLSIANPFPLRIRI